VRLGRLLGTTRAVVEAVLPEPLQPWAYASIDDEFWHGCTGSFRSEEEIEAFAEYLEGSLSEDEA